MSGNISDALLVERYKYILDQKKSFFSATFKILTLYQAVLLAVSALQFRIIEKFLDGSVDASLAAISTWSIYWMHSILAFTCIASLVSGIISWLRYKKDEYEIEKQFSIEEKVPTGGRSYLKALSWFESWIMVGIIGFNIGHFYILRNYIMPIIE